VQRARLPVSGNTQDSSLISPVTDLSARTHPILSFGSDWYGYTGQAGDLDLSVDGGTTWSNLRHYTASQRGPRTETVDLSAAAGKSAVQVRFHFTGEFGYYWQVDDVFLGDRTCDPSSGGLVVGQVTDTNTGAGVGGATVASVDRPAEQATSAATPDDPNLGDGFFRLFSLRHRQPRVHRHGGELRLASGHRQRRRQLGDRGRPRAVRGPDHGDSGRDHQDGRLAQVGHRRADPQEHRHVAGDRQDR
jgi:hypothetical protein